MQRASRTLRRRRRQNFDRVASVSVARVEAVPESGGLERAKEDVRVGVREPVARSGCGEAEAATVAGRPVVARRAGGGRPERRGGRRQR